LVVVLGGVGRGGGECGTIVDNDSGAEQKDGYAGGCIPGESVHVVGGAAGVVGVAGAVIAGVVVIVVEEASEDRGCGFESLDEVGVAVLILIIQVDI